MNLSIRSKPQPSGRESSNKPKIGPLVAPVFFTIFGFLLAIQSYSVADRMFRGGKLIMFGLLLNVEIDGVIGCGEWGRTVLMNIWDSAEFYQQKANI
jgi:hypothetical protein